MYSFIQHLFCAQEVPDVVLRIIELKMNKTKYKTKFLFLRSSHSSAKTNTSVKRGTRWEGLWQNYVKPFPEHREVTNCMEQVDVIFESS